MAKTRRKRVGLLTGGGDCPGLNAVIRAVVHTADILDWDVVGLQESFGGLLNTKKSRVLNRDTVRGILHTGGTILGTTNRGNPFEFPGRKPGESIDRSQEVVDNARSLGLEGLIAIGGDGTLKIALSLSELGLRVVGVPKTIDNDVSSTYVTFGFDSACAVATDALDRLHTTAFSHRRVMILEVMGRNVGWIAAHSGIAGGADVILIPEIPYELGKVCDKIRERESRGRQFSIIVAAEGAMPKGGKMQYVIEKEGGFEGRLGGVGEILARDIEATLGCETRALVLGHLQRGGRPTNFDRLLGTRYGSAAMRLAASGEWGQMVALKPPTITSVPLESAVSRLKRVPKSSDMIRAARDLGISFGD